MNKKLTLEGEVKGVIYPEHHWKIDINELISKYRVGWKKGDKLKITVEKV